MGERPQWPPGAQEVKITSPDWSPEMSTTFNEPGSIDIMKSSSKTETGSHFSFPSQMAKSIAPIFCAPTFSSESSLGFRLARNLQLCHPQIMALMPILFFILIFVPSPAKAMRPNESCPSQKMPAKWQRCSRSNECVSIYMRCISEPLNKAFKKKAEHWLKGCNACDAAAVPHNHAVCKHDRCELDPPR